MRGNGGDVVKLKMLQTDILPALFQQLLSLLSTALPHGSSSDAMATCISVLQHTSMPHRP